MKLPAGDHSFVDAAKVRDYLLSSFHRVGRSKAKFFRSLGYTDSDWPRLAADIRALAASGDATLGEVSAFGQKYEVRGILRGPSGRPASVITVWIVLVDEELPRFVTAYPGVDA